MKAFAAYMKEKGWNIEWSETQSESLPEHITNRYKNIPEQWTEFIRSIKRMISSDETTCFLCTEDFDAQSAEAFQWDEWERISLESAGHDEEQTDKIKKFWDAHLPIVMSVNGGYSYYAIAVKDGSIVYGTEPEFEACENAAASFTDFLEKILKGKSAL